MYAIQFPRKTISGKCKSYPTIDPDTKWWNEPLIQAIFHEEETVVIFRIPLSKYGQKDILIWKGSTAREFTLHMKKDRQDIIFVIVINFFKSMIEANRLLNE